LFVLATLQLRGAFTQPASHAGLGVTVLYYGGVVPFVAAWLVGAAAVWLLWRPASAAFFKPPGSTQARRRWPGDACGPVGSQLPYLVLDGRLWWPLRRVAGCACRRARS